MDPKVSIILPIYNGEKKLQKTLDSLLIQSFSNFELIACIDGTSDGSEKILSEVNDRRIKIIKNSVNMGLGRTLNRLITYSHPKAKYIAMAEQDDWYYPYRIEKQVEFLDQNQHVGLVSGIAEFHNGEKIVGKYPGMLAKGKQYPSDPKEMIRLNYRFGPKVQQTCMMFRKKVHIDNGLYFTQHFHTLHTDWVYILRFALVSEIKGLHLPLVIKDRSYDRISATKNHHKVFDGSKELIKSMYWEMPGILSQEDYKFALNTKILAEGKNMGKITYLTKYFEAMINYPLDPRLRPYIIILIKKLTGKLNN